MVEESGSEEPRPLRPEEEAREVDMENVGLCAAGRAEW